MKHKHTRDDLNGMTKDELVALAEKEGLTVERGDGAEGDPRKADYVDALSASDAPAETPSGPAVITSKSREKKADETIPGGKYVVNGRTVNSHGQPIDEHGTVKKAKGEE